MLSPQAVPVLEAIGYRLIADFDARAKAGVFEITEWKHSDPQPSEQQINDWAEDVNPLPSGQLFSEWHAEHGGNAVATLRRQAREELAAADAKAAVIRAAFVELRERHNQLLQWLGSQAALVNRGALPDFAVTRQSVVDRITNGEADS